MRYVYKTKQYTKRTDKALEDVEEALRELNRQGRTREHSHKLSVAVEALLEAIEGELP